ncbi:MAG TPA: hypothetical protein VM638_07335 [Actinomycetota bacterium]|nr:hypothetical protein [Actinomycetota bacterium]
MPRCPNCHAARIVIVVGTDRRSFCVECGTKWIQDGSEQRSVETTSTAPQPA